jgi:hypothetical protein
LIGAEIGNDVKPQLHQAAVVSNDGGQSALMVNEY